jgi:rare lipoprotein A
VLKVVRRDNGESVEVRVNDRGPYVGDRILDLSVAAGKKIGLDKVGHAYVTATVIE